VQLKIKRSQRTGGVVSKSVIFCLDARAEFTAEEQQNITRYKLGNQVIYNSEEARRNLADAQQGGWKGLASLALASMKLYVSVDTLQRGQHIECKSLDELLGAEEMIYEACRNLRTYLDTAATFDGREVLVDFSTDEPQIVAQASTPTPKVVAPAAVSVAPPIAAPEPMEFSAEAPAPVYEPAQETYPSPSVAQAQPQSFFDRHKWLIIIGGGIFVLFNIIDLFNTL